jgi:hypothetical protein
MADHSKILDKEETSTYTTLRYCTLNFSFICLFKISLPQRQPHTTRSVLFSQIEFGALLKLTAEKVK